LDFLFSQAEVKGFHDELLHGWADLQAARVNSKANRLMANVSSDAALCFDETLPFKNLVDLADREEIDVELGGKLADRRELRPVLQLPGEDTLLELMLQLHIEGNAAVGIQEKHGVVEL